MLDIIIFIVLYLMLTCLCWAIMWMISNRQDRNKRNEVMIEDYEIVEQILDNIGSNGMGVLRSITRRDVLRWIIRYGPHEYLSIDNIKSLSKEDLDLMLVGVLDQIIFNLDIVGSVKKYIAIKDDIG